MIKHYKMIKEDKYVRQRGKGFMWDSLWWLMFFMLGWWVRGFVNDYYGTNLTLTETIVRVIQDTGGFKALILFLVSLIGSITGAIIKLRNVFEKRNGD